MVQFSVVILLHAHYEHWPSRHRSTPSTPWISFSSPRDPLKYYQSSTISFDFITCSTIFAFPKSQQNSSLKTGRERTAEDRRHAEQTGYNNNETTIDDNPVPLGVLDYTKERYDVQMELSFE
jgi:hypothetical protein